MPVTSGSSPLTSDSGFRGPCSSSTPSPNRNCSRSHPSTLKSISSSVAMARAWSFVKYCFVNSSAVPIVVSLVAMAFSLAASTARRGPRRRPALADAGLLLPAAFANRYGPWFRRHESGGTGKASSGLEECQQIGVELVLVRVREAMGCARVDLQGRVLPQFRRTERRVADRHDLVVIAVNDQRGHVELLEVFGEVRLGECLDALEGVPGTGLHPLQATPPRDRSCTASSGSASTMTSPTAPPGRSTRPCQSSPPR